MTAPSPRTLAQLEAIVDRLGVRRKVPHQVLEDVQRFVDAPGLDDPTLIDLTELPFVTIDNATSRDLDQALLIRRDGSGYIVDYALADASYAVRPGSAIFDEALARGATYYLPGFAVPMLPQALSEDLVSLNADVVRRALNMRMHLDTRGAPTRTDIFRARIKSRAKLAYGDVESWMDGETKRFDDAPYAESLRLLAVVGELRIRDQVERDVVQHHRRSTEVVLDEDGNLIIVASKRRRIDRYNEQISLLCNIEGARFLRAQAGSGMQPIFKVHASPPESRVDELETRIRGIWRAHGEDPDALSWRPRKKYGASGETLASYLGRLSLDGPQSAIAQAIHRQAIWINRRSEFALEAAPHHGIGAEEYARFSAPMREVVGIFTHKEALEALAGTNDIDVERDIELQKRVVDVSNRAKALQSRIEKETERLAFDGIIQHDLENERPIRDGIIMGLARSKVYVDLESPPLEVKLYADDIAAVVGDTPTLSDDGAVMTGPDGHLAIGDRIRMRVHGVKNDRWSFEILK